MTLTTANRGLAEPEGTDSVAELRLAIAANATALDNAATITQGLAASRPTSGMLTNDLYWSTDLGRLERYNGSAWDILSDARYIPPIGALQDYAGSADPTTGGWLIANGRSMSRSTYASLFAVIGTAFGAPDGSSFSLPDLRGRVAVGAGSGAGLTARTLGAHSGEEAHVIAATEIAPHQHTFTTGNEDHDLNHSHAMNGIITEFAAGSTFASISVANGAGGGGTNVPASFPAAWTADSTTDGVSSGMGAHHHGGTVDYGGGPGPGTTPALAHNNMQPYAVLNKIIRVV